ncbi:MAG: TIGR04282 family arsenosugar biosynthesis glycosyltransferase [Leptospirillum sp.]|jgi:hypothetical protein
MVETTLVLVCKRPSSGTGKQRLARVLGHETAEKIATALLDCALEDCRGWPGPVVISPSNPEDREWASSLIDHAQIVPQCEGNLGERLNVLDRSLRRDGLDRLVYIGSDAPCLGEKDFSAVRGSLNGYDVALAPAEDGGVVLMASREPWPDLRSLPWSTEKLWSSLEEMCRLQGWSINTLRKGFDVDWPQDLARVVSALSPDPRPSRQSLIKLLCRLPGDSANPQGSQSNWSH